MSEKEAKAIGLESFDATKAEPKRHLGVHCVAPGAGPFSLTIFRGGHMDSIKRGAEGVEGIEQAEGPSIGQNTYWYTSSGFFQVYFLSENGNYIGSMLGKDKDALAEIAAKVAPYLNKP